MDIRRVRPVAAVAATVLAALLVFLALVVPDQLSLLTPAALLRVPVEAVLGAALLLVLPPRPRRITAIVLGALLGLVTIVKILDMGFFAAFDRPFDPVIDWTFFGPAVDFLSRSAGRTAAVIGAIVAVVLAIALPVVMAWAVLRLTRSTVERRTSVRVLAGAAVVWVALALLGTQIVPQVPVASASASGLAYQQVRQVVADVRDKGVFAAESAQDPFRNTVGADLLTGLRGKDVVLAFVESYGRVALEDPALAPQSRAALDEGNRRLRAAGFSARTAYVTSPTSGGGSWLAHSTLQSGLWINTQQRYVNIVQSDRLTLSVAFKRAGWRTVGMLPANTQDWPEGAFYGFDQIYDARNIGYKGPSFAFASTPDQYTMSAFQRLERSRAGDRPVMAEIDLLSSHAPWEPVPPLVGWGQIGDGTTYATMTGATDPADIVLRRDQARVKADYGRSVRYSLDTLVSYVETYGDDNLVLILLGDHQPAPIVAGDGASRDSPITIVAKDPAVLDRVAGWGWADGLNPGSAGPVWRMDTFRDRFLTAFGPKPS